MKISLSIVVTLFSLLSCDTKTSKTPPNTIPSNLTYIDTFLLNQMNVQHRTILKADLETWILNYTKPVEASNLITLSYFYSCVTNPKDCNDAKNWFQMDSIQAQLKNGKVQTLKIQEFTAGTNLAGLTSPDSKLIDINFDGNPDVDMGLNEVSGATNEMRTYFVFNPDKDNFEDGIDLANLGLDNEAKLLYTSWSGGHAGRISGRTWSSFVGYDRIRLEKAIYSDFNKELDAYVVETIELNSAGNYLTSIDTVKYEDWE